MKKVIVVLLIMSILPLVSSAGDNWYLYFSDGLTTINGTNICVSTGECLTDISNASGDITAVNTNGPYLTGGGVNGAISLLFNDTFNNATILSLIGSNSEPLWSANLTAHNVTWSSTFNSTYDAYNSSGLIINWSTSGFTESDPLAYNGTLAFLSEILGFGYFNSTDFSISDYYLLSNPFGYFNSTNPSPDTNETSFVTNLTSTNCGGTNKVIGVQTNGTVLCNTDLTAAGGAAKKADGIYLYNDSLTIFFNDTKAGTNLSVNSSDNWDGLDSYNATQMEESSGLLSITISWFSGFFDDLFGLKDTDDLTEGSTNLYDNQSWNQTFADTLYADIDSTEPLWSANLTAHNATWTSTFNATYDSFSDTNASTACSAGEYLDGGGACPNFNDTVSSLISSKEFNASVITTLTGTLDSGDLDSILLREDGDTYNVSEVSGTPGWDIVINFTGVDNFNTIVLRELYEGSAAHVVNVQLRVCGTETYQTQGTINNMDDFGIVVINVFDSVNHICGGDQNVSLKLIHSSAGNINHNFFLDSAHLIKGASTSSPTETDPLSIHSSGDVKLSANWNQSNFNLTGEKSYFLGTSINAEQWVTNNSDTISGLNTTQLENNGGLLSITISWFSSFFDDLFGGKDTDDLTEGSSNLYDNQSWNQTRAEELFTGIGITGNVSSVSAGDGMDFSTITGSGPVTMGTPGTLNGGTANSVSGTSHLHAVTTDASGACDGGSICGGGHTTPASEVTAGSFGTGDYIFDTNVTVERIVFENDASHFIEDNSTCLKLWGSTSVLEIC